MIQAYSNNINVSANTAIPLNNVKIRKGCNESLAAPATIQLNKRGVYVVSVDAYGSAAAPGEISVQLVKNGIPQPSAISQASVASANSIVAFGFEDLVQVPQDNNACCCTSPTELSVVSGDTNITGLHINVVVTKLC